MLSEFPQGTAPYESQTQSRGNLSYMETISTWLAWLGPPERIGIFCRYINPIPIGGAD